MKRLLFRLVSCPWNGGILDGVISRTEEITGEILSVVELPQIFNEFVASHFSLQVVTVEVSIEEHDCTGKGVDCIQGPEMSRSHQTRVAFQVPLGKMKKNPLTLLRFAG